MERPLNEVEARVLGSLIEKQVTTPEYYPLTLNALVLACNQKSNRHPVVSFDEATVAAAVESLRDKNLVYVFYGSGSRVPKYKHVAPEILGLDARELAVMCVLMLRGPQTAGELRARTDRLYDFSGPEEVEETLASLIAKEPEPLVAKLPRQPGQKEGRFAHLLSGEVSAEEQSEGGEAGSAPGRSPAPDRYTKLEQEVETLREQLESLRREFEDFKNQFG